MKKKTLLIIILVIAFSIRILGLNNVLYHEEADNTNFEGYLNSKVSHDMLSDNPERIAYLEETGYNEDMPNHGPLSVGLYFLSARIFGDTNFAYRVVVLIFGLLVLWYVYRFVKLFHNEETAWISVIIAALSFWITLGSISIDQHSAIAMFMFTAACYHFIAFERSNNKKDFYLSGFFMGLAFLTSYISIVLGTALAVYIFVKNNKVTDKVKAGFNYFILPIGMFALFPIIAYFVNWSIFLRTFSTGSNLSTLMINYTIPAYFIIWGTMLIPGLFLLSLIKINKDNFRTEMLLYLLIGFGIFYNLFNKADVASLDRYLMPIIPAMIILSSKVFSDFKFEKIHLKSATAMFTIGLLCMIGLNTGTEYYTHNLWDYAEKIVNLEWNFYFPITGISGPVFGVSMLSILAGLMLGTLYILGLGYAMIKKNDYRMALAIFLGLFLAQNVYMSLELVNPVMHPDVTQASMKAFDYIKKTGADDDMLYTNFLSAAHYLNKDYNHFYFSLYKTRLEFQKSIQDKGGTGLIVQFTKIKESNEHWKMLKANCREVKSFSDKGQTLAYVYEC